MTNSDVLNDNGRAKLPLLSGISMKRITSLSLRIGMIHLLIVGLCAGLLVSPLGSRSGPMPAVLMIPFFYCLLSFIPALVGVVIGLVEVFRKEAKTQPALGLSLNTAYLTVFISVLAAMRQLWMSV